MKIKSRLIGFACCVCLTAGACTSNVCSDGFSAKEYSEANTVSIEQTLEDMSAQSIYVIECQTGEMLFEKNSTEQMPIGHLAKLMTVLLTAEKLESGEITLKDMVVASANANSMEGTQIWLDKGEKISVEELLKSIIIGNANDACVALAEYVGESEENFVAMMNCKAKELDMKSTIFKDSAGMSEQTVSTAYDLSILAAELVKHEDLTGYFTTWLDTVRNGKAELVSQNRLIRTYSGITGLKSCAVNQSGECAVVTAKRNGFSAACVLIGCDTSENRTAEAKKLLDMSFESYCLYTPEITDDMLESIAVTGGESGEIAVELEDLKPVVIPRGLYSSVQLDFVKEEIVQAPVGKGDKVGSLTYVLDDQTLYSTDLVSTESVKKMNFKCGFLKLMYNLIKI